MLPARATTNEYMSYMPAVYDKILACFALGLGRPEDYFKEVRAAAHCPVPSAQCLLPIAQCPCHPITQLSLASMS